MYSKQSLELTLAIIKPHIVKCPFALKKIQEIILDNDFRIVRSRRLLMTREEAEIFYANHKEKFFYNRLVTFMTSGPSDLYILAAHDAVNKWRQLLGPTKFYEAQFTNPNSIRGMFGLSDTRNAVHGSDSKESAEKEISLFFKDFNVQRWYEVDEAIFNSGNLHFDSLNFVHTILEPVT